MSDENQAPIVIDLGKQKNKKIKRLKRSRGELAEEIMRIAQEQANGAAPEDVVPVVVLYREKRKRRRVRPLLRGF